MLLGRTEALQHTSIQILEPGSKETVYVREFNINLEQSCFYFSNMALQLLRHTEDFGKRPQRLDAQLEGF